MQNQPHYPPVRRRRWFQFSLRTMLLAVLVVAWCAHQFSVGHRRHRVQNDLNSLRCSSVLADSIQGTDLSRFPVGGGYLLQVPNDDLSADWLTILTGSKNRTGVVVVVPRHFLFWESEIVALVCAMPNVDRVLVYDYGGDDDNDPGLLVAHFKQKIRDRLPKLNVERAHLPGSLILG